MKTVAFIYQNAKGVTSQRNVSDFSYDSRYLKGICASSGSYRTFRRDRIVEILQSSEPVEKIQPPAIPAAENVRPVQNLAIEIMFTGFPRQRRADLESLCAHADIRLRKTVTQNLSFICAGPNAGPTKMAKAQSQGVAVLDEADLIRLLETGEIPE